MTNGTPLSIASRRLRLLVGILMMLGLGLSLIMIQPAAAQTEPERSFVFTGQRPISTNFDNFANATGTQLDAMDAFPADLSVYACVVLPGQMVPFSQAQIDQLAAYIQSGGTVIATGDNAAFVDTRNTMNALSAGLGSGMAVNPESTGFLIQTTFEIDASPLTEGVVSIQYASTSTLLISGNAQTLVRVQDGRPFIGAEQFGDGFFVLSGDSNVFATMGFDLLAHPGNAALADNLCTFHAGPNPPATIDIDMKPFDETPQFDAHSNGALQIVVFGSDGFDVQDLDLATMRFGPDMAEPKQDGQSYGKFEDEDGDGFTDVRLKFRARDTGAQPGDVEICLTGFMRDGSEVQGCTDVDVIGGNQGNGKK